MGSVESIALEFEEEKVLDWKSEVPEWIKEGTRNHEFRRNYLYIWWHSSNRDKWPKWPEEAAEKMAENLPSVRRILTLRGNNTSDYGVFKLFDVTDGDLELVEKVGCSFSHVEGDFGGVFGEDRRKPQRYFFEEHGFRLEYYYESLTEELEDEF